MNIFILSHQTDFDLHIKEQARSHCDKHVIKMITESVQMLSTALVQATDKRILALPQLPATAAAYAKHPCTLWTGASLHNFVYLAHLALALCDEKLHRWPLNGAHIYHPWIKHLCEALPSYWEVPDSFPIAIPDNPQATKLTGVNVNLQTAADLYQRHYATHKASFASWKNRAMPVWFLLESEIVNMKHGV